MEQMKAGDMVSCFFDDMPDEKAKEGQRKTQKIKSFRQTGCRKSMDDSVLNRKFFFELPCLPQWVSSSMATNRNAMIQ